MTRALERTRSRVAKCQGFWGLIRVKIFAGWGEKFGRTCNFAKSRPGCDKGT